MVRKSKDTETQRKINQAVAKKWDEYLKDNNVSKSASAAQLNVTPIMITHYLHGGVAMRTENLIILAKLMNTTVDDLLKTEEV